MNKNLIIDRLKEEVKEVRVNEPMSEHTTFKVGGPADIMVIPKSEDEILSVVKICREENIDFLILGNGSNLLVKDGGIRGIVIKINEDFSEISIKANKMYCQAGALMTASSRRAMDASLTGFEFANGIPGSIGGAMTMNAGAYGGEMKDIVSKVRAIDRDNNIVEYSKEEMNFRYRGSRVDDEALIVLGAEFDLEHGDPVKIKKKMQELTTKRTSKQPIGIPSGGSTFKRPEGYYAAKLIEDAGLKGLQHRGAQVSDKHAGFIVNNKGAKCQDIIELIKIVQKTVKDKFGVSLEREVKLIGEED